MNRAQAIDKAVEIVQAIPCASVQPPLRERVKAIVEIANFLWEPDDNDRDRPMSPPPPNDVTSIFGWFVDNRKPPTQSQYKAAMHRRSQIELDPHRGVAVAEINALDLLVSIYEALPTTDPQGTRPSLAMKPPADTLWVHPAHPGGVCPGPPDCM